MTADLSTQKHDDADLASSLAAARLGDTGAFASLAEPHRRELLSHCYRMLGSPQDAEDLVQETYLRAWRRLETYQGRASFRAWLYKIATNACLDYLDRRPRRILPQQKNAIADLSGPFPPPVTEPIWIEPFPDEMLAPVEANPEARYESRESISLAFLVALQVLAPRQRCALILGDVLDWTAAEIADVLGVSVSAVNSLLHHARTTLKQHYTTAAVRQPRPIKGRNLSWSAICTPGNWRISMRSFLYSPGMLPSPCRRSLRCSRGMRPSGRSSRGLFLPGRGAAVGVCCR